MSSQSDISPTASNDDSLRANYQRRGKSKLVSNGALQHLRMLGNSPGPSDASSKRVAFSRTGVGLALSSIASSEDEQYYDSDEERDRRARTRELNLSDRATRKSLLKRLSSYPMTGYTQSLDSQALEPSSSFSNLPEFNKRPLTDTPVVSSFASPVTRSQSSEDEDNDHTEDEAAPVRRRGGLVVDQSVSFNDVTLTSPPSQPQSSSAHASTAAQSNSSSLSAPADGSIPKTKNISHLNLAELDSRSVSPNDCTKNHSTSVPSINTPQAAKADKVSQLSPTLLLTADSKNALLDNVSDEMRQQFEKSPSIEKLKSLLLTKPPPPARKAYTLNIPGQTSSKTSPDGRIASIDVGSKLVIVMVGLPARGKSYITNKLTRYLNWLQHDCRVFNVGNTRRKDKNNAGPETNPLPDIHTPNNETSSPQQHPLALGSPKAGDSVRSPKSPINHNADFFNPENNRLTALREKWAMDTLDQLLNYVIDGPGLVGIFDATNSTKRRRYHVLKRIQERSKGELKVLFLESICSDPAIIESNIRLKLSGPDYREMDPVDALQDFVGRLHNYEKAYETIDEQEEAIPGFQYVKMINVGKKVVSYNIQGFLASQTIYFLLNFNLCERQIWITRHGESVDNLTGRIGGDSHLTKRGQKFAKALAKFMNFQRQEFRKLQLEGFLTRLELKYNSLMNRDNDKATSAVDELPSEPNFCVWTSMLCRAIETGQYFDEQLYSIKEMRMLNELGGGKYEGMTYEEIQAKHPKEFQARLRNKLTYRYPGVGGESYLDVLTRLRPLITEIERTTDNLLIVSHRVVLRILLAYFLNLDNSSISELDVPLHTLYCLELKPYGTDYRMYEFDEGLDWFVKVEPEHHKNVKEVGVAFKERKYSVVPTAPPSTKKNKEIIKNRTYSTAPGGPNSAFSIRRSLSFGSNNPKLTHANNPRALYPLQSAHAPSNQNQSELPNATLSGKKTAELNRLR
jgi:6-phosphofructo-2-kinase